MKIDLNETVNILLGFGGSGGKTIAQLMGQMANDPAAARIASERVHIVLVDTDDSDLEKSRDAIIKSFHETGIDNPPPIELFRLADSVDLFQDLVSERLRRMDEEARKVMRDYWWFESSRNGTMDRPFSAATMPENVNRGAAQCPLVSHFLAWDKLEEFEQLLERIAHHCKNKRNLEHFSVDLFLVAGLAGGTGRGCWQALSFKAREYFWQDKNGRRACRPIGFFFDWSCFRSVAKQRPEQAVKLQVNSYTGLSELSMWLRSSLPVDGVIANHDADLSKERSFLLPSLKAPADRSAAAIDTERYMMESDEARLGRTPIHRAYIFTDTSRSMAIQTAEQAYELAAAAIYGRLVISQTRSADSNEPERACATATSMLSVPVAKIRLAILRRANAQRVRQMIHGESRGDEENEPGQPLTKGDRPEGIEVVDAGLKLRLDEAGRKLVKLLSLGSADNFASIGGVAQKDPGNPLSIMAFAVSRQGEQGITGLVENGAHRDQILDELRRALGGVSGSVPDAMARAFEEIVQGLSASASLIGESKKQLRERQRRAMIKHFVEGPILKALDEGIAPARAMSDHLRRIAVTAQSTITRATAEQDSSVPTDGVGDGKWAKECFGFFKKIKQTQADTFRSMARERLCRAAFPHVARELRELVRDTLEAIDAIDSLLGETMKVLLGTRVKLDQKAESLINHCFTRLDNGDGRLDQQNEMYEALRKDRLSPVSKMIRSLRPIYRESQFNELVARLGADSRAVQSARADLREFVGEQLADDRRRTERNMNEYRTTLEERLKVLLARQSIEYSQLRDCYNVQTVLEGLVEGWFETFKERRGDSVWGNNFSYEIEALTGYDLASQFDRAGDRQTGTVTTVEDLRPPASDDLVALSALRLAAGCDPFVQYVATGDRRDRATLILPTASNDELGKRICAMVEDKARESQGFAHVKAVSSASNHFMIVATADLPKTNFVNTGWDGWFSDPTDPIVRNWLEWCEDPRGKAPFKTDNGSVGLGYICPKYVRDPHLSIRRWRPWFKSDRNLEHMQRKWVALAYSLIGNTWYREALSSDFAKRYEDFVKGFNGCFGTPRAGNPQFVPINADYPDERWTLPLIHEAAGGPAPTLQRGTWVQTPQGLRLSASIGGAQGIQPRDLKAFTSSMHKFVNWFDSDQSDAAVDAILQEQSLFAHFIHGMRNQHDDVYNVTSTMHVEAIRKFLTEYVRQWSRSIQEGTGLAREDRERQVEFLQKFSNFFDRTPELNLLEPFDGSRL